MIPPRMDPSTVSPGEREIFELLRDDPNTEKWIVLHSLDIAQHSTQAAGEADFIIIVPSKGVLCLEVKACTSLRRESGNWFYGNDRRPDSRGPFKQASAAMHSLRRRVVEFAPGLKGVLFWSGVVLPFVELSTPSPEWHPWQLIDKRIYKAHPIGKLLLSLIENARRHMSTRPTTKWFDKNTPEPTAEQCATILRLLRPDFEFFESPRARASRRREELKKYTEEQLGALDAMEENPRVMFEGPAGTGKTLLAIEAARRSVAARRRVLFVCYNRLLGRWLEEQAALLKPLAVCGTIHRHMLGVAGLKTDGEADKAAFWQDRLPTAAAQALIETPGAFEFDELVVDEAQDLLRDKYLDFFDLCLKGGLKKGRWRLFGDFEKQSIYSHDVDLSRMKRALAADGTIYSLRVNCRNTPRIGGMAHLLGGLDPKYKRILRPDNGVEPEIQYYASPALQQSILAKVLDGLLAERYSYRDVVILSPRADGSSAASLVQSAPWKDCLRPLGRASEAEVKFGTIHAFKGLEAPVVIVTDIEHIKGPDAQALFYIAVTRPLDRLIILADQSAKPEVLDILLSSRSKELA